MMPGAVQIVNMRPGTPTTAQAQPKTVATVSPRVVISNPHMVATRPANSGVNKIKLNSLLYFYFIHFVFPFSSK